MELQDKSLTTLLFKEGFPGKSTGLNVQWVSSFLLDEWKDSAEFQQYLSDLCSFSMERLGK